MARTMKDAALGSREARTRLKARKKPYWRQIEQGRHIGYYKGARTGTWTARLYYEGRYHETKLGAADDTLDADGNTVFSFPQAQEKARTWFASRYRQLDGLEPASSGPVTVGILVDEYLGWFEAHRKAVASTRRTVERHIRPSLGATPVGRLSTAKVKEWHQSLAAAPAMLRTSRTAKKANTRPAPRDAEARRRRQATANRVLTVLKAALNHGWREGRVPDDSAWRKVRPFRDVDAPVIRYLTGSEAQRLVNACRPDFRQLVRAALLSGCRYGELTALHARDFNPDSGTLLVRHGKSGKRHVVLTDEGRQFFSTAAAGKAATDTLFLRVDGKPWGSVHQIRPMREACIAAKIKPAASFHVLRHTYASILAMRGVPLPVIAEQLGHADTRMTEKHYAHLSPSYVADTIRQNFPDLGITDKNRIRRIGV